MGKKSKYETEGRNAVVKCLVDNIEWYQKQIAHKIEGIEECEKRLAELRREDNYWAYDSILLLKEYLAHSIFQLDKLIMVEEGFVKRAKELAEECKNAGGRKR